LFNPSKIGIKGGSGDIGDKLLHSAKNERNFFNRIAQPKTLKPHPANALAPGSPGKTLHLSRSAVATLTVG
jgi:hypothetical protein